MQLTKLQKVLATVFIFCAAAIAAYYHIYRPIPSRINIDAIEDIHGSAFDEAVALLDIEDVTARSVEIERLQSYFDSKPVVVSVSLRDPKLFRKHPGSLFFFDRIPVEEQVGASCARKVQLEGLRRCTQRYMTLPSRHVLRYNRKIDYEDEFLYLRVVFDYDTLLEELD